MLQGKCTNGSLTLVLICATHVTESNAKFVKHLVTRVNGLLTNTETVEDATDIIKSAYIAFMSEFTTPSVQDTLDNLSRIVNEFRMNAKESATEKQTDIDNEADCGVALVASKSSNKFQKQRATITSF